MEITKDFLKQKNKEYLAKAEQHREQFIFNTGAAEAILRLIGDMSMEEITPEDIKSVEVAEVGEEEK